MEIVLKMYFLILNNADIQFIKKELIWKIYIIAAALSTTGWIEFIKKKDFAQVVLNKNIEVFVVYVAIFTSKMTIH